MASDRHSPSPKCPMIATFPPSYLLDIRSTKETSLECFRHSVNYCFRCSSLHIIVRKLFQFSHFGGKGFVLGSSKLNGTLFEIYSFRSLSSRKHKCSPASSLRIDKSFNIFQLNGLCEIIEIRMKCTQNNCDDIRLKCQTGEMGENRYVRHAFHTVRPHFGHARFAHQGK